jgi:hypothetical protein
LRATSRTSKTGANLNAEPRAITKNEQLPRRAHDVMHNPREIAVLRAAIGVEGRTTIDGCAGKRSMSSASSRSVESPRRSRIALSARPNSTGGTIDSLLPKGRERSAVCQRRRPGAPEQQCTLRSFPATERRAKLVRRDPRRQQSRCVDEGQHSW